MNTRFTIINMILVFYVGACSNDNNQINFNLRGTVNVPDSLKAYPVGVATLLDQFDEVASTNNSDTVTSFYIPPPVFNTKVILKADSLSRHFKIQLPNASSFQSDLLRHIVVISWIDKNLDGEFDWPYEAGRFPFKNFVNSDSCLTIRMFLNNDNDSYSFICNNDTLSLDSIGYDGFEFFF
ncbi:hypothetical protein JNL27_00480 [bacterium]|nr:hypothetical protein [bacterium]